jgi:hypothetical protein
LSGWSSPKAGPVVSRRERGEDALVAPSVKLVVEPPPAADTTRYLASWSWLLPPKVRALAVNRFGDWYLETPDGAVHLLSIWEGTFTEVAASAQDFGPWLATPDGMESNYCELVLLMHDRGKTLGPNQCFAFVPPPILTPEIDTDAIVVQSIGSARSSWPGCSRSAPVAVDRKSARTSVTRARLGQGLRLRRPQSPAPQFSTNPLHVEYFRATP